MVRRCTITTLLALLGSCSTAPEPSPIEVVGRLSPDLKECLQIVDGSTRWQWHAPALGLTGPATLEVGGRHCRWSLADVPDDSLIVTSETTGWLSLSVAGPEQLAALPPLPRRPVESPAYADLVSFARAMIMPRFDGRVPHWPSWPVPVSSPDAISGDVDLAACLREAVEIWNTLGPEPWFEWREEGGEGIRLAHYAGSIRSPALSLRITRVDSLGRPLKMRISVGDNYHSEAARPYAVRGLSHELGHAVLLWGHSVDRRHLLWGDAPPLHASPSKDEVRAAQLLRHLPHGLDLRRYGAGDPASATGHQAISATGRPSRSGTTVARPESRNRSAANRNIGGNPSGVLAEAQAGAAPEDRSASSIARSSQPSSLP